MLSRVFPCWTGGCGVGSWSALTWWARLCTEAGLAGYCPPVVPGWQLAWTCSPTPACSPLSHLCHTEDTSHSVKVGLFTSEGNQKCLKSGSSYEWQANRHAQTDFLSLHPKFRFLNKTWLLGWDGHGKKYEHFWQIEVKTQVCSLQVCGCAGEY